MPEQQSAHEHERNTPSERCHNGSPAVLVWSLLAAAVMLVTSLLGAWRDWSLAAQILIALLPIAPFVGMFISMIRASRRLDEMQRRIQLEALAITVVASSLIFITIGQFQEMGLIAQTELTMAWVVIALTYIGSYLLVKRWYHQ